MVGGREVRIHVYVYKVHVCLCVCVCVCLCVCEGVGYHPYRCDISAEDRSFMSHLSLFDYV